MSRENVFKINAHMFPFKKVSKSKKKKNLKAFRNL
jgi:hypothetical protein